MIKSKLLIIGLIIFSSLGISAQDAFHYTHFDMAQVALNPGLAGGFEGTARVGALFREQDFGLVSGQYRSPIFYVDAPLIRGFRKYDWIGFGFSYQYDHQALNAIGNSVYDNAIITSTILGGLSYHFALDKKREKVLAIGFQTGNANVYFDNSQWISPRDADEMSKNPGYEPGPHIGIAPDSKDKKNNNLGYTIGAVFTSNKTNNTQLKLGVAVSNISLTKNSRYSILKGGSGNGSYEMPLRFSAFGKYKTELSSGLILQPKVFFQYLDPVWEASTQVLAGMKLTKPMDMILYGGIGYNITNGLQFLISADIKDIKIVYGFDLNLSDKTAVSGAAGAFELGASYIIKIHRKPKPDPVLLCPQI